jgi:DeoR/GlpR family transcriptional regulator of sugar metabolism
MKNNRKAVDERQLQILNMIRNRGEVKVEELANTFQISLMTVRRDLQYLEQEKLIARIHGGAVSLARANRLLSQDEKILLCRQRISEYAARFIEDGDRIFVNGSRTALDTLKYVGEKKVTVVTNNCWGSTWNFRKMFLCTLREEK